MKEKIFAEIGLGNESFFSTEFEKGDREYRIKRFVKPTNFKGVYLRIWIMKKVFVFSSYGGFSVTSKHKNKFKFLFGVEGEN